MSYPVRWHGVALSRTRVLCYNAVVSLRRIFVATELASLQDRGIGTDTGGAGCRRVERTTHTLIHLVFILIGELFSSQFFDIFFPQFFNLPYFPGLFFQMC